MLCIWFSCLYMCGCFYFCVEVLLVARSSVFSLFPLAFFFFWFLFFLWCCLIEQFNQKLFLQMVGYTSHLSLTLCSWCYLTWSGSERWEYTCYSKAELMSNNRVILKVSDYLGFGEYFSCCNRGMCGRVRYEWGNVINTFLLFNLIRGNFLHGFDVYSVR